MYDALSARYGGPPSMWRHMGAEDLAVCWAALRRGRRADSERVEQAAEKGPVFPAFILAR